jgi:hypothetical protein
MTKLTPDLPKDVTTLLQDPENQKIVNEGQDEFETAFDVGGIPNEVGFKFDFTDTMDFHTFDWHCYDTLQVAILKWSIKLLPAFQTINPYWDMAHELMKDMRPQTLSEALLKSGAMTVEELNEEYKRLTK